MADVSPKLATAANHPSWTPPGSAYHEGLQVAAPLNPEHLLLLRGCVEQTAAFIPDIRANIPDLAL